MKTFTIEWNAVMTLEHEDRPGRDALLGLISLHGKTIDVGIVTTAASENTRLREMPASGQHFDRRLKENGLGHLSKVTTILVYGLTYIGYARCPAPDERLVVRELWDVLPGDIPMEHLEFAKSNGIEAGTPISSNAFWRWRNKFCDVYSLQAHSWAGRDIFVTGDVKNFRGQRRKRLMDLGVRQICDYDEALEIAKSL